MNLSTNLKEQEIAQLETVQARAVRALFDGPLTPERLARYETPLRMIQRKIKGAHVERATYLMEDADNG